MSAATTEASHHTFILLSPVESPSSSLGEEKLKLKKKDTMTEVSATVCANLWHNDNAIMAPRTRWRHDSVMLVAFILKHGTHCDHPH